MGDILNFEKSGQENFVGKECYAKWLSAKELDIITNPILSNGLIDQVSYA